MGVEEIVAVDEVLETAGCFEKDAFIVFEDITERLKHLGIIYTQISDQSLKINELSEVTERQISNECYKQELFETNINQNTTNIENFEVTVHELEALNAKKERECSELERKVRAQQDKINSVLEKRENINRRKDIILAYKILTKVDFVYSSTKIKGLVNKEAPKPFILDPKELLQKEITMQLWDIIGGE